MIDFIPIRPEELTFSEMKLDPNFKARVLQNSCSSIKNDIEITSLKKVKRQFVSKKERVTHYRRK